MSAQSELHDELLPQIMASIVKPPLEAGGDYRHVLILLESVVTGVILSLAAIGGDNIIADTVLDRVRDRVKEGLAKQRLGNIKTAGSA